MGNQRSSWQKNALGIAFGFKDEPVVPFPGKLKEQPLGCVEVPLKKTHSEQDEHFRDLARTLRGGGIYFIARSRMHPLHVPNGTATEVGKQAPSADEDCCMSLSNRVREELLAQGSGLRRGMCLRVLQTLLCRHKELTRSWINVSKMRQLLRLIAAYASVGTRLHVAWELNLPSTLWQPLLIICIGAGQVRAMSFSFVGDAVLGDRPENKVTPFALCLISDDILSSIRRRGSAVTSFRQHFIGQRKAAGTTTMLEHVASFEEDLFRAVESGDWTALAESQALLRNVAPEAHAHVV